MGIKNRTSLLQAFLILCLMASGLGQGASAEIYKWIDKQGVLHFGDRPPHDGRATGKIETLSSAQRGTHDTDTWNPESRGVTFETPTPRSLAEQSQAYEDPDVELYTTSWCHYCQKARDFFRAKGIAFTEYDIEDDEEAARRKEEFDGRPGVPLAVINDQRILGFSKIAYEKALRSAQ